MRLVRDRTAATVEPDPRIIECYKLAVEMADRVSARRAVANAFFLTVNTTLVTAVGLHKGPARDTSVTIAIYATGMMVAICWWLLLRNYRNLNEAKFAVINNIEREYLPVHVFLDEWEYMTGAIPPCRIAPKARAQLKQLGTVERIVPCLFCFLYLTLMICRFCS